MAETLDEPTILGVEYDPWANWRLPEIEWVNGVPGCGKTTWIVDHFHPAEDLIITTTREAAKDVTRRVESIHGPGDGGRASRVRTLASVLVNGVQLDKGMEVRRLLFDEALMNHFGAVVMACRLTQARKVVLIGDVNQIPYIDRKNCFPLSYEKPDAVTGITKQLVCTHRNPLDVTYAMRAIYDGIYSSRPGTRSLRMERFSGTRVPGDRESTLYLTHNQGDKKTYASYGYGTAHGSRLMTIHEAQGLTYENVIIIRPTTKKLQIFESTPHAVVAVTRHTSTCTYYSDENGDAIARLILSVRGVSDLQIIDYNVMMALRANDNIVAAKLREKTKVTTTPTVHESSPVVHARPAREFTSSRTEFQSAPNRVAPVESSGELIPHVDAVALVTRPRDSPPDPGPLRDIMIKDASGRPMAVRISDGVVRAAQNTCIAAIRKAGGVTTLDMLQTQGLVEPQLFGYADLRSYLEAIPGVTVIDAVDCVEVRVDLVSGFLAAADSFSLRLVRTNTQVAYDILRGLCAVSHRTTTFICPPAVGLQAPEQTVAAAVDKDVNYLQTMYDEIFPGHAEQLYERDQRCVDGCDLQLSVDRLQLDPGKSFLRDRRYVPLQPKMNTMMPGRRGNSQREAILGLLKRNLNAPELTDPAMSRSYVGELMAKNFLLSVVEPSKAWMLEDYKRDPIELCTSLVDRWLDTQKPTTAARAGSDTGMELRGYNMFSYMVKPDLKPPLESAAAHEYASVQTIAYHSKDVNAIFCPLMLEVRDRLLRLFPPKLKIFTGMSPDEFVDLLNSEFDAEALADCVTVENDMRKYDKSQDAAVLQFECTIMLALGVSEYLVEYWYNAHTASRLSDRSNGVSAQINYQRRSGDASTFLGNTMFVMAVALATYDVDDIVCGLFAGDDSLLFMRSRMAATCDYSERLAALFNLECKLLVGYNFPYFCSKFLLILGQRIHLVPDPVKFLTKLGRRDMRNYEHVEEYRRSAADNMAYLGNQEWYGVLSAAIIERYRLPEMDFTKLFKVMWTVTQDPALFATLYVLPEYGEVCPDVTNIDENRLRTRKALAEARRAMRADPDDDK